ncbi:MAG: NADPH-dependent assimilatory sulfite reductase hemoprotein subunit, partial [Candidatus Omnitrophica bacterium]|nr:NADPH-dependent assimilatory sulfite reductase hemoprotein subunit [Candidatus Omnitrophota bacterium]
DDTVHNLLKFHGFYQQDDRDLRQKLTKEGKEKHYMFMVRTKVPGGKLTWNQYLTMNDFADRYANGTLRITTRQGIQFHGVIKKNLKTVIKSLNEAMITTLGACGDIERNVVSCPAPLEDRTRAEIQEYAKKISDHLLPKTRAYHEIWLDGEKVTSTEQEIEPLYGKSYLPRKFKTTIAFPGDNCVDVYAQDLGLVAVLEKAGELKGFNVLVGGGLGMTQNKVETHPLLAKPLGYVGKEKIVAAAEAVIKVHRDYGDRENRKRARLKYLIEDRGIDWFYAEVRKHTGFNLEPITEMKWDHTDDHLGWFEIGRNLHYFGIFVENGRIQDAGSVRMKSGLKKLVEVFKPEIRLTPQQNILLSGIPTPRKSEFERVLKEFGIRTEKELSNTERWSMACPALPTCGLAIAEAERVFPKVVDDLEKEIVGLSLQNEKITIRMTGCPNGCARPYTSEIGLVGSTLRSYSLYLGGNFEGTRLAQLVLPVVKEEHVVKTLSPILKLFKSERKSSEHFGDFCMRKGISEIQKLLKPAILS